MQAPVFLPSRDTTPQIIIIGISKDLQLCVEGGFSQIQSHIPYIQIVAVFQIHHVRDHHSCLAKKVFSQNPPSNIISVAIRF